MVGKATESLRSLAAATKSASFIDVRSSLRMAITDPAHRHLCAVPVASPAPGRGVVAAPQARDRARLRSFPPAAPANNRSACSRRAAWLTVSPRYSSRVTSRICAARSFAARSSGATTCTCRCWLAPPFTTRFVCCGRGRGSERRSYTPLRPTPRSDHVSGCGSKSDLFKVSSSARSQARSPMFGSICGAWCLLLRSSACCWSGRPRPTELE